MVLWGVVMGPLINAPPLQSETYRSFIAGTACLLFCNKSDSIGSGVVLVESEIEMIVCCSLEFVVGLFHTTRVEHLCLSQYT